MHAVTRHAAQRGTTMIEVLLSIVIVAVGLMGLARLQTLSQHNAYDAQQRIVAAYLAKDMVERMRANPIGLEDYVSGTGVTSVGRGSLGNEPTPDCDSLANACEVDELAGHDLWEWEQQIDGASEINGYGTQAGGLVSPTGCITGAADGSAGVYTVAIAWRGKVALTNPGINACGAGSGLYGGNNEYRRVLVVQSYFDDQ